ncbi:hypothetical protein HMPREF9371_1033 [Neisseria shayeganii 871]|uniref:Uncharacterized protein n=1 Tax=Neisseria shayeganii 871 TaxID=1032488 RepID=G4CHE4_9NEIS|nr:hypothetical protein HMPREF9371_1033 [Neisseria shayeganii 871]
MIYLNKIKTNSYTKPTYNQSNFRYEFLSFPNFYILKKIIIN